MTPLSLRAGLVIALLTLSITPIDALAGGADQSRGQHLAKGHYKSGIVGQSVLTYGYGGRVGEANIEPYPTTITVFSGEGEPVTTVETDEDGYFEVFLKPGDYTLRAYVPPIPDGFRLGNYSTSDVWAVVENKAFTQIVVYSAWLSF